MALIYLEALVGFHNFFVVKWTFIVGPQTVYFLAADRFPFVPEMDILIVGAYATISFCAGSWFRRQMSCQNW